MHFGWTTTKQQWWVATWVCKWMPSDCQVYFKHSVLWAPSGAVLTSSLCQVMLVRGFFWVLLHVFKKSISDNILHVCTPAYTQRVFSLGVLRLAEIWTALDKCGNSLHTMSETDSHDATWHTRRESDHLGDKKKKKKIDACLHSWSFESVGNLSFRKGHLQKKWGEESQRWCK